MQFLTANQQDIPLIKEVWNNGFNNKKTELSDFLFSTCNSDKIYLAKNDDAIGAIVIVSRDLTYKGKKGFYLNCANSGDIQVLCELIKYCVDDMCNKGYVFCAVKPNSDKMSDILTDFGFGLTTKIRKANIEIKRNIWQLAEFDIATASRLKTIREKYCDDNFIRYTSKDYEKYAMYLYTYGGSTAETDNAFAIYYLQNDTVIVKEMLSENTVYATKLLQAIRERTGCEKAEVYLSQDSNLLLGEGKFENSFMIYGLDNEDVYLNLMFE